MNLAEVLSRKQRWETRATLQARRCWVSDDVVEELVAAFGEKVHPSLVGKDGEFGYALGMAWYQAIDLPENTIEFAP